MWPCARIQPNEVGPLKKVGRILRDAWLIAGITVLLFCLLEATLSLSYFVKRKVDRTKDIDPRSRADTYSDQSWVAKYYEEFRSSNEVAWQPYVYWRRKPYEGETIHIDAQGIRRTYRAETADRSSPRPKIFMFGGSALWGTGARDEFTIPSILAKELEQVGIVCDITNFGESGYVSTQEVITLLLRLQKGDVPDLVIFYDGVNDAFSAYQQNSGGLPLNEFRRVSEFNLTQPEEFRRRRGLAVHDAANRLATTSFLHGILRRLGVQENARSETEPIGKPSGPLDASLDQDVVHTYCSNMDLAKTLGDRYGFSSLIYWQPTIFHKGSRTPYEQAEMDRAKATEPFYRTTYELIERHRCGEHRASFHDLSGIFAEVREPVFVDWCHLGETGNEIVAKRIAQDVIPLLSRKHPR